ncbi:hypothetical protein AC578_8076 [Pseudocercospora eumusae]|uniref:Amidase domain-containing protein n=1 Tax=Pseudocercospora eumusae TaxID=321146 RepID=A0A139H7L4_9PEZI|nr:hypothetical protein AC578_8076 [Pseudocercospora eumusae]
MSFPRWSSIEHLQSAIAEGKITVKEATKQYLESIERQKDLNAVTAVNPKALEEAEALDSLRSDRRGPLHGLPIIIKDQIETAGIPTAYGSIACKDQIPPKDATLVTKLRQAGAVILGKSTMPDWAAAWFSTSSLSQTTRNPFDGSRDPGGSSSGSGTAVAADMALAAIGGDTGGSIRLPSSFCGLVGVRVTPGRISRDGMSSLVLTQDTPGPMTKTVSDAAKLLDVLVGYDENDDFTSINALTSPKNFQNAIKQPSLLLNGKRLGVLRQVFGSHKGINHVLNTTLQKLQKDAACELIDVSIPNLPDLLAQTSVYILRSKSDINTFLQSRQQLSHLKIEDLHASKTYHQTLDLINALVKGPSLYTQSPHFGTAMEAISRFQRVVASLFAKYNLDAMIYPTCQVLAPKTQDLLESRWSSFDFPTNTVIGSQLLWTAVSVPVGGCKDDEWPDDPELPVGLEILGTPLSEEKILGLAAGVEELVSGVRKGG